MDVHVTTTQRQDEFAPPPPKNTIGKLPKGARPESLPRAKGELYKSVAQWADWGMKQKNAGSEQFRYLVRTMYEVETLLNTGEKTLNDFKGQVRNWQQMVKEQSVVAAYETTGAKMQKRLQDLRGDTGPKHLEQVYSNGGQIGTINEYVLTMDVWLDEERRIKQGKQIINDRLIFAATNLAPLLDLRGRFVFELSTAHVLVNQWRREFERELERARIANAEKARKTAKAARTEQRTSPSAAPDEERWKVRGAPSPLSGNTTEPAVCAARRWSRRGQGKRRRPSPSQSKWTRSCSCCTTSPTATGPRCGARGMARRA